MEKQRKKKQHLAIIWVQLRTRVFTYRRQFSKSSIFFSAIISGISSTTCSTNFQVKILLHRSGRCPERPKSTIFRKLTTFQHPSSKTSKWPTNHRKVDLNIFFRPSDENQQLPAPYHFFLCTEVIPTQKSRFAVKIFARIFFFPHLGLMALICFFSTPHIYIYLYI